LGWILARREIIVVASKTVHPGRPRKHEKLKVHVKRVGAIRETEPSAKTSSRIIAEYLQLIPIFEEPLRVERIHFSECVHRNKASPKAGRDGRAGGCLGPSSTGES
jgi:hypothetical protein